ncbi:hypothetical protein [Burkholderia guangdongensis]|uniref:hypothetical protein n=1 Tax=Burkholderia guangdongensis TaxID=1792500 RepID=UPI001FEBD833|nr:hypothetical protein [Burkholderia guangdongensis]
MSVFVVTGGRTPSRVADARHGWLSRCGRLASFVPVRWISHSKEQKNEEDSRFDHRRRFRTGIGFGFRTGFGSGSIGCRTGTDEG